MQQKKTALIAGATGLIGKSCLQYLLEADYYTNVIVLTRKPTGVIHNKLKEIILDFDQINNYKEQLVADHIFCCLGTTMKKAGTKENFRKIDLQYPIELAKITCNNGAVQYNLVSALGADKNASVFYNKVKGETEELIKNISFTTINIYRPSILLGDRKENRPGEKTGIKVMSALSFLFKGPLAKYKPIQADVVARAMVVNAIHDAEGVNIYESDKIKQIA